MGLLRNNKELQIQTCSVMEIMYKSRETKEGNSSFIDLEGALINK